MRYILDTVPRQRKPKRRSREPGSTSTPWLRTPAHSAQRTILLFRDGAGSMPDDTDNDGANDAYRRARILNTGCAGPRSSGMGSSPSRIGPSGRAQRRRESRGPRENPLARAVGPDRRLSRVRVLPRGRCGWPAASESFGRHDAFGLSPSAEWELSPRVTPVPRRRREPGEPRQEAGRTAPPETGGGTRAG